MKLNSNLLAGAVALAATAAFAGEAPSGKAIAPVVIEEEESIFDKIWGLATIYEGDGPFLQELSFIGRYHGQYFDVDGDEQGSGDDWDNRRARLGLAATIFNRFDLEIQWNLDVEADVPFFDSEFFQNIEDAVVSFEATDTLEFSLGKQKPVASREYNTSSKRIKTIERSLLANRVSPRKIWGIQATQELGDFDIDLGVFSGELDTDLEFSSFDAGVVLNAAVTYNGARLSYLYDDGDIGNSGTRGYDHIVSLSYVTYGKKGYEGLGFFTEGIYAEGNIFGDAYGITVMPSYMITSNLEAVLRYHYAGSDGDSGLAVQSRYDRRVDNLSSRLGDHYHGVYGGLNYYIYGDKLKLMTGVEYGSFDQNTGDSLDVLSLMGGVRLYF